jgi:hypothetical protein
MDDNTKNIIIGLAAGALKKILMTAGAAAAAHGFTGASGTSAEAYGGIAVAVITAGIGFWNDYGRAIVTSQLEVLKARSLAAAKKINDAGLKPVTVTEIAAQSPTLTEAQVTKIATTMPTDVKASVIPLSKVG